MNKKAILTVCSGNIHRSVIAQLCLSKELDRIGKSEEFEVISRGIQGTMGTEVPRYPNLLFYEMEFRHTKPCLEKIGITIPADQKATLIDEQIVKKATLILAMDEIVLAKKRTPRGEPMSLVDQFPKNAFKMRLFMELVGKKENVPDCGDMDDAALHNKVVTSINETAKAGVYTLIHLAKLCSIGEEKI